MVIARLRRWGELVTFSHTIFALPFAASAVALALREPHVPLTPLRVLAMLVPASRDVLEPVLAAIAVATLILGPLGAIAETNLRRALGFLVIGGIGASLAGLALAGEVGLAGAASYVLHAMLTMTAPPAWRAISPVSSVTS